MQKCPKTSLKIGCSFYDQIRSTPCFDGSVIKKSKKKKSQGYEKKAYRIVSVGESKVNMRKQRKKLFHSSYIT